MWSGERGRNKWQKYGELYSLKLEILEGRFVAVSGRAGPTIFGGGRSAVGACNHCARGGGCVVVVDNAGLDRAPLSPANRDAGPLAVTRLSTEVLSSHSALFVISYVPVVTLYAPQ